MFDPIDIAEINDYIRFWLGDLTESDITDVNLNRIIQQVIDNNPTYTGCDVVYYSTIEVLKRFIREAAKGSSGQAGSGAIKSVTEKTGNVSFTTDYDVGVSGTVSSSWSSVLDDLLSSPDSIGCPVTRDVEASKSSSVIFGGVSQSEYDRVRNDPDSRNGWNYSSPFRQTLADKLKR